MKKVLFLEWKNYIVKKKRKQKRLSLLQKKWIYAIIILLVYLFGRSLPIFTVPLNESVQKAYLGQSLLESMASVSGMQIKSITVFSLGLSPWMSSVIIWRVVGLLKVLRTDRLTAEQSTNYQTILMFVIALLQSIALTANSAFVPIFAGDYGKLFAHIVTIIMMVAGTFVLTWLGSMNSEYGMGGYIIIMLVNMLLSFITLLYTFFSSTYLSTPLLIAVIIGIIAVAVAIMMMTIFIYRGQYRIPLRSMSIHNDFMAKTYLPIPANPAGGMPAMYGMTLMTLPVLIFQLLSSSFPKSDFLKFMSANVSIRTYTGAIIYIILLWFLTIGFSYINMDPEDIAFKMKKNGEYIDGIYSGVETERFLRKKISIFAKFGAAFIVLVCGVPTFISVAYPEYASISTLFSYIFIVTSLMFTVIEQVSILRISKKYSQVLD